MALFVAFLLAAVCVASSGEYRPRLLSSADALTTTPVAHPAHLAVEVEVEGVQELGEGKTEPAPTAVFVPVNPSAPKPPTVTVKTLLPKFTKKLTDKYSAANGGKQPSVRARLEINRLAVIAAAKSINDSQQAKDATEAANRKLKRTHAQLEHDYMVVTKTEQNLDYAAQKAYVRADAKVAKRLKVYHKSLNKSEKMSEEDKMLKLTDRNAVSDKKYIQKQIRKYKALNTVAVTNEEKSKDYVSNAKGLEKKTLAKAEMSKVETKKYNNMLNSVEMHEAKARLKMRQARISAEFENGNARKVGMLLSRLTAKRDTVKRFTANLRKKSGQDFKAARAGIAKAKSEYAAAKAKYDEYTKKAGELEEAYQGTLKTIKLARMTVVNSIDAGNSAAAIQAAERHKVFTTMKNNDKKKVDNMDLKAKSQQLLMNTALSNLAKAEALETVARKQIDMVKEHEVTMAAQNGKITLLKAEVTKHKDSAKASGKEAHEHYLKLKGMRRTLREERNDAQARDRYANHISLPMTKRMQEKAKMKYARDRFANKSEQDDIHKFRQDATQITINARNARKKRTSMKKALKLSVANTFELKRKLQKAEGQRDKTLDRNKKKMKQMRSRLADAERHFNGAGGKDMAMDELMQKLNTDRPKA